jgi:RNA polymerase sigma factor (sigma-70 family)
MLVALQEITVTGLPAQDREQIAQDCALVAAVLSREAGAEELLAKRIYTIAQPLVRGLAGPALANDVMTELLARVWENNWRTLRQWRQESPLSHYLIVVSKRFAIDYIRSNREAPLAEIEESDERFMDTHWASDPERMQEVQDVRRCLDGATGQLSPPLQRVVRLRHHEGLGHQEIADRIGKSMGYVGPTLARAERQLREALRQRCRELLEALIGTEGNSHG